MSQIVRTAMLLWVLLAAGGWMLDGLGMFLSVLAGGTVALINFRWMAAGVDPLLTGIQPRSPWRIAARFVGRLLLILGVLFAMIHVSFLNLPGAVAGLCIFVLSGMVEAVRLLIRAKAS